MPSLLGSEGAPLRLGKPVDKLVTASATTKPSSCFRIISMIGPAIVGPGPDASNLLSGSCALGSSEWALASPEFALALGVAEDASDTVLSVAASPRGVLSSAGPLGAGKLPVADDDSVRDLVLGLEEPTLRDGDFSPSDLEARDSFLFLEGYAILSTPPPAVLRSRPRRKARTDRSAA